MVLTQDHLKTLLHYDPLTGAFTRMQSVRGMRKEVGSLRPDGYRTICVNYKQYLAHRLVWLWVTGSFPVDQIDHFNGVRSDNRFENLRPVSNKENHENTPLYSCNKTGERGVYLDKRTGRYVVRVKHHGKDIHIGVFDTVLEAGVAAKEARDQVFTHHNTPYAA